MNVRHRKRLRSAGTALAAIGFAVAILFATGTFRSQRYARADADVSRLPAWLAGAQNVPERMTPLSAPDESHGDALLARLRRQFVGRRAYGYGGIALTCAPQWTHVYGATVPVRVRSVDRLRGETVWIGTGRDPYPYVLGNGFLATDPVVFVFDEPEAKASGANYGVPGERGPCPAIVLADRQVDVVLTTSPPPNASVVRMDRSLIGATRDTVAWRFGYPNEIADRATLRSAATWRYDDGPTRITTITFRGNHVSAVVTPGPLM